MLDPELVPQPTHHRLSKYPVRFRKCLHAGKNQPLEFDKRFLEENDVIEIRSIDCTCLEAEIDGVLRKFVVMLLTGKSLFFGGSNELTIAKERCRGVVKIAGDTKDIHLAITYFKTVDWHALARFP